MSATDRDLFGQFARTGPKPTRSRTESNDMDLVESVIRTAATDGYAIVGPGQRVYRRTGERTGESGRVKEIERVPAYESEMVHQLLRRGLLKPGGRHTFCLGGKEGPGLSVLVPKQTKSAAQRWSQYRPLPAPRSGQERGTEVTQRKLICPECGEPAQQKKPRRWSAANGPAPRFSHLDGEPLCPVMGSRGYEPARPRRTDDRKD